MKTTTEVRKYVSIDNFDIYNVDDLIGETVVHYIEQLTLERERLGYKRTRVGIDINITFEK